MLTFALLVLALFAAILICLEIGWRVRSAGLAKETPNSDAGLNALDGAVFGLMGLLIAFTFSGAASRFEVRRSLIVQETNDIGTAYLRLDMLPADAQPALRQDFRDYVDARLRFYASLTGDLKTARAIYLEGTALQQKIWAEAVAASARQSSAAVTSLVLSSLNSMIDDTTTRLVALETHPPLEIYIALAVVVMASSLLAGFAMAKSGRRNWTHMLILIRIDSVEHILVDLRSSMK
jgi:hypothetical protein